MLSELDSPSFQFKCPFSPKFTVFAGKTYRHTNYPCNQALHYKGNRFVVTWISGYFKTFKMPVVNLQRICFSGIGRGSPAVNFLDNNKIYSVTEAL